jgi:hypothetical protein
VGTYWLRLATLLHVIIIIESAPQVAGNFARDDIQRLLSASSEGFTSVRDPKTFPSEAENIICLPGDKESVGITPFLRHKRSPETALLSIPYLPKNGYSSNSSPM